MRPDVFQHRVVVAAVSRTFVPAPLFFSCLRPQARNRIAVGKRTIPRRLLILE